MTTPPTQIDAEQAVAAAHRSVWSMGDYPALAEKVIPDLGSTLVTACGVRAGDRVLDVAAGSGNAALPAARLGARVVACDLTAELLAAGERRASAEGLPVKWRPADAQSLPFDDDAFDVVMSCIGVMFAPQHQVCADELVRVCRPGGTIGVLSWTPEGFIGELFAALKPYAPPPAAGAQSPLLWGSEGHVVELFGDRVEEVVARREPVRVGVYARPEEFRDDFKARYGPIVAVYQHHADDPAKTAGLDAALDQLACNHGLGVHTTVMDWEYLLVTVRKSGQRR